MEKKTVTIIRESKEVIFNILKNAAPSIFGTKTYADVLFFGQDDDSSKLKIIFNEE